MRTPVRNKARRSVKLCLSPRQAQLLHLIVQNFEESGDADGLTDKQQNTFHILARNIRHAHENMEIRTTL